LEKHNTKTKQTTEKKNSKRGHLRWCLKNKENKMN
jgi:hypothetical protein